ncbi:hypothetical protein TNCV_1924211 [Trichonephila clavipes]|nr:hypothetical protein TNCV_1924211 [Trichonephila clavipes]
MDPANLTSPQKEALVDWCKGNVDRICSICIKGCITSTHVKNQGSLHMSRKQNSNRLYGFSKTSRIQQKLIGQEACRNRWLSVSSALRVVTTVVLEQSRMVDSDWYTTICLREVIAEI